MPTWAIVLLSIAALFISMRIIGTLLPAEFRASVSVSTRAKPEAVWNALIDYHRHPMSAKMCRGIEDLPDVNGLPSWRENIGHSHVRVETVERAEPRRIVRKMADEVVPMTMTCEYRIEPVGDSCVIHANADGEIRPGTRHVPIFKFMIHVFGAARTGQRHFLRSIVKTLDH